jgi:hypothetical protein
VQWLIEKRLKSDGSLTWAMPSDPSTGNDRVRSITSDTDYLYIAGGNYYTYPGNMQWYTEKRAKVGGYVDIGLRAYNGTEIITIACEPDDAISSALRIVKDSKIYGIVLVDITDPDASSIRIRTSSGVKALKKL